MRDEGVGSILVVDEKLGHGVAGIFTERDVMVHLEQIGCHDWQRPIRLVMTSPVVTVPLSRFGDAAKIMVDQGFRHLPIVSDDPPGHELLLGVISMRDLLHYFLHTCPRAKPLTPSPEVIVEPRIAVIAGRAGHRLIPHSMLRFLGVNAVDIDVAQLAKRGIGCLENLSVAIVDLESTEAISWIQLLASHDPSALPKTVFLYDPSKHSVKTLEALRELDAGGKFALFAKPLNLIVFVQYLRTVLTDLGIQPPPVVPDSSL